MSDEDRAHAAMARRRSPAHGVDSFDYEEPTGVGTDPQVFRAVKRLRQEHDKLSGKVDTLDEKLDGVTVSNALVVGKLEILTTTLTRPRTHSSDLRHAVTSTLAERVLAEQQESVKFSRALTLKVVGGLFSAGAIGALVTWLLQR
jgi:hypothetical protein